MNNSEAAKNAEDSNPVSEESESSGSQNEASEQKIKLFKSLSRIAQSITYSIAYWSLSAWLLNKISRTYFPDYNIIFKWNIYDLIKK